MNPRTFAKKLLKSTKVMEDQGLNKNLIAEKPYISSTKNVEVSVWPEFIDSKSNIGGGIFIWAYHVRIQNNNLQPVKLINRRWRIIDEKGNVQEVSGEGVIGEQPTIAANSSYQYSSGVHLRQPSGIMTGKYEMKMLAEDYNFEVPIPKFSLDSPVSRLTIN